MFYKNLKTQLGIALSFIMIMSFFSCGSGRLPIYFENRTQDEIPIDVLKPGELAIRGIPGRIGLVYLPENFKKVNVLYINSSDEPDDTLTHLYATDILNGVYDGLFEQINSNTPIEIIETKDTLELKDSLVTSIGRRFSEKWQVDGVLVTNRLQAEFKYVFLDEDPDETFTEQVLLAGLALELRMYDYEDDKIITWSDTLSDHFYSKTVIELMGYAYDRTPISDVDGYLGYELGKQVIKKAFPYWKTVNRKYYGRAHRLLRKAKRLVIAGEWEAAGQIWTENRDSENRVLAKHCEYNLILYQEVLNNLEKALEQARLFDRKYSDKRVNDYINTLEQRIEERKILDKQLNIIR